MLTKAKQPFACPVGDQNYPRRTKVCDLISLVGAIKSATVNTTEWFKPMVSEDSVEAYAYGSHSQVSLLCTLIGVHHRLILSG